MRTPEEIIADFHTPVLGISDICTVIAIAIKEAKVEYSNAGYQLGYQTAIDVLLASQKVLKEMDTSTKN